MRIFEDEPAIDSGSANAFSDGEPLDVFSRMPVFVEFDSDHRGRRPVERVVAGHPGRWIFVYSSLERLINAHHGDEVEYSRIAGGTVLELLPDTAGVWFDRSFAGGRKLVLPPVQISTDVT